MWTWVACCCATPQNNIKSQKGASWLYVTDYMKWCVRAAWGTCSLDVAEPVSCLTSVSCYYFLLILLLFFAKSWIICVRALLLDDSRAVGLQSVFHIRWIMNKPLQQKSRVLHEPAALACQLWRGQVNRNTFPNPQSVGTETECVKNCICTFPSSWNFLLSFHVPARINLCFVFSRNLPLEINTSLRISLFLTRQTCVKSAEQERESELPHYYYNIHSRASHPQGDSPIWSLLTGYSLPSLSWKVEHMNLTACCWFWI